MDFGNVIALAMYNPGPCGTVLKAAGHLTQSLNVQEKMLQKKNTNRILERNGRSVQLTLASRMVKG